MPKRKSYEMAKSPRKMANNQIDPDYESHYKKKKRLSKKSDNSIVCTPIDKRYFHHIQSNEAFLIENNNNATDDSGDDIEYKTLYQHIHQMEINQNRSLNEGEKKMFNLWNQFIEGEPCFGIKHMRIICQRFIDANLVVIIHGKLYRNFFLHLCGLYDQGLLTSLECMYLMNHIQQQMGIKVSKVIGEECQKMDEQKKKRPRSSISSTSSTSFTSEEAAEMEPKRKRRGLRSINTTG